MLLILFAFLGMVPSQLTYFLAISAGNAATATILQFWGRFLSCYTSHLLLAKCRGALISVSITLR